MPNGKGRDWIKLASVTFVIALIAVFIIDKLGLISGVTLGVRNIIFFVLIGVALYVSLQLVKEAKAKTQPSFMDVVIYVGVLVGLGYLVVKFNLVPTFSVALQSLIS